MTCIGDYGTEITEVTEENSYSEEKQVQDKNRMREGMEARRIGYKQERERDKEACRKGTE